MADILKNIKDQIPSKISDAIFEGANIVLYTNDKEFFKSADAQIRGIVDTIKKRIELRADKSILASEQDTEKTIRAIIPEEAEITNIIFDVQRSIVIIEAKKPGLVIGKQGSILNDIKKSTFWIPVVQRSPAINSKITEKIRSVLYANNTYRRKLLNDIGRKIYKDWNPEKMEMWVRLTYLGGGRQVGRSCLLLHTPNSKIILDCGINPAILEGSERFPYLDVAEIGDLNSIDAVILSHAHLDHCLPPDYPVLTKEGYKKIDEIKVGEDIISMNWKTGKYESDKCIEKTKTTGHKSILTIKTPYSSIESSPNHRFFTFENLKLKELRADELKEGMFLPSNIFHKPLTELTETNFDTNVEYDERRRDKVILPTKLSPQIAEFIGYYMGDGHKSSEFSLRLTDASTQILEHHKNMIKEIFNYEGIIRHHPDKTKNAHVLEINNVKIIRFLEKNFPKAFLKTRDITIPEKIIRSHSEIHKAFVRGFTDAEGTVTNIIKITSFSDKMLNDLQYIFSLQGIPSNIKSDHSICLNTKFSIYQFYNKVGLSLKKKKEKLRGLAIKSEFKKENKIPLSSRDFRNILKEAGLMGRVHNSPRLSNLLPGNLLDFFRGNTKNITKTTLIKLISFLETRISQLDSYKTHSNIYALRQLLSISREEISISTGLKTSQIQQIEERRFVSPVFIRFSEILSTFMKEKLSTMISQTNENLSVLKSLASMELTWEKITSINEKKNPYDYLVDIEVEKNHNFIAGNLIVHNCGLIPYLYKMGYKGPVYLTAPTRDIAALLQLDLIGVAYKKAEAPIYKAEDIKEMVRHSISLNYGEVTDITPDIRITFYNAGHVLGSAQTHINIGNGLHNFVYSGDTKYGKTRLLDPAVNRFPRIETLQMESTYGGKADVLPPRDEVEKKFLDHVKSVIESGGKILLPELGLGHAQETVLRVEEAVRNGTLPKIPVYIDGMIWDINAIHTAYPDFLSASVRNQIFQDNNPFISEILQRVGSPIERRNVIEGGPCIIIATSGMLAGGASVEYFKNLAGNEKNLMILSSYQGPGSLGRRIQDGERVVQVDNERVEVRMQTELMSGLSPHSSRNELVQYVSRMLPKPKKIIINHGEQSKSIDLASSLYKNNRIETVVPKNLETIRFK